MQLLHAMVVGLLLSSSVAALADDAPRPPADLGKPGDARLVPAMRDGVLVGVKVYAIRAGGRFDQAKFMNGDTIETVDGASVVSEPGKTALLDKVVLGKADATVGVRRQGELVTLESKAAR